MLAMAQPLGSGEPPPESNNLSYANTLHTKPKLPVLHLASRPVQKIQDKVGLFYSLSEIRSMNNQFDLTIILKFSNGRPTVPEIQEHIYSYWGLRGRPMVGLYDSRHVLVHLDSEEDLNRALARQRNEIKTFLFRIYRWTADFVFGRDSSIIHVWIKLPQLPLTFYNVATLMQIGSLLGKVLEIDEKKLSMSLAKPIMKEIWLSISHEDGFWQQIEVDENPTYCNRCGLLGHTIEIYRNGENPKATYINKASKSQSLQEQRKEEDSDKIKGQSHQNTNHKNIEPNDSEKEKVFKAIDTRMMKPNKNQKWKKINSNKEVKNISNNFEILTSVDNDVQVIDLDNQKSDPKEKRNKIMDQITEDIEEGKLNPSDEELSSHESNEEVSEESHKFIRGIDLNVDNLSDTNLYVQKKSGLNSFTDFQDSDKEGDDNRSRKDNRKLNGDNNREGDVPFEEATKKKKRKDKTKNKNRTSSNGAKRTSSKEL